LFHETNFFRGIFLLNPAQKTGPGIEFFSFATSGLTKDTILCDVPVIPAFSAAQDGQWIVYMQADSSGSDLMLVENFR
jgi:hypothetical protein